MKYILKLVCNLFGGTFVTNSDLDTVLDALNFLREKCYDETEIDEIIDKIA